MDDGDIYAQTTVPIENRDDVTSIYDKVTVATQELVRETLDDFARGTESATEQDTYQATYRPQRKPEDGIIDWSCPAGALADWVRALSDPYPGAFTFRRGRRLTIWRASATAMNETVAPGTVTAVDDGRGVVAATGDGRLRLQRVQLADGPRRWADDAATAWELRPGDRVGHPSDFPDWIYTELRDSEARLDYETNVSVGERVSFNAAVCSHANSRNIDIEAVLDGQTVFRKG